MDILTMRLDKFIFGIHKKHRKMSNWLFETYCPLRNGRALLWFGFIRSPWLFYLFLSWMWIGFFFWTVFRLRFFLFNFCFFFSHFYREFIGYLGFFSKLHTALMWISSLFVVAGLAGIPWEVGPMENAAVIGLGWSLFTLAGGWSLRRQ